MSWQTGYQVIEVVIYFSCQRCTNDFQKFCTPWSQSSTSFCRHIIVRPPNSTRQQDRTWPQGQPWTASRVWIRGQVIRHSSEHSVLLIVPELFPCAHPALNANTNPRARGKGLLIYFSCGDSSKKKRICNAYGNGQRNSHVLVLTGCGEQRWSLWSMTLTT